MDSKGFLDTLMDFTFTNFITTKIIKFLYIVACVFAAIGVIAAIIGGFSQSIMYGLGMLIISPILLLLYIVLIRVWMEMIIVVFRIGEGVQKLVSQKEAQE
jgi:uncharacterized membrane protein